MRYSGGVGGCEPLGGNGTGAGSDLRRPDGFTLGPGASATIHTGVHVELPHGTCGLLVSKSGLNVRDGIVGTGLIDEGYSGEVVVRLYNLSDHSRDFQAGDKIIQLVVLPVVALPLEEVDSIEVGERGDAGFGSTGR